MTAWLLLLPMMQFLAVMIAVGPMKRVSDMVYVFPTFGNTLPSIHNGDHWLRTLVIPYHVYWLIIVWAGIFNIATTMALMQACVKTSQNGSGAFG